MSLAATEHPSLSGGHRSTRFNSAGPFGLGTLRTVQSPAGGGSVRGDLHVARRVAPLSMEKKK